MDLSSNRPKDWQNPELPHINRLRPHCTLPPQPNVKAALNCQTRNSPYVLSLDGP